MNDWIRGSGKADAVIDFDKALADPGQPSQLRPDFDCGDHLHPSDAGYLQMAQGVDLKLLE